MSEALPLQKPPRIYYDGFASLDGGMDGKENKSVQSEGNPNGLQRNQVTLAINSTFRGGLWTHRPVYMRRPLQFENEATAQAFATGLMQGYSVHEATESSLIVSVGGRQYQVLVENGYQVRDLTPANPAPSNIDYAWFLQAGPFTIRQDGSSVPLIFDGATFREATVKEIKPGGPMAFSQGRIWYAVKDIYGKFTRFRASDLIGVKASGTAKYQYQDSVLLESENTYLNEGGDFSARSDMGEIRAMVVPRMLDTSLGQGPLQVFCERGAMSVQAPIDRDQWKNVTYPIQTESTFDYGALGGRFAANANGDIIYRSLDGVRSFKLARADFSQWINTGISNEINSLLAGDAEPYLFYGSALVFDNRFLASVWPRPTPTGFVHDGIVALDFDLITSMRQRAPVAWEGVWTGISMYHLVKGTFGREERCFAFARNKYGNTELWEILRTDSDEIWDNGDTPIIWSIETPSYDFDSPYDLKRLKTAAIWREDIRDTVQILYQWRPDQHPCFLDWHQEEDCAPYRQCTLSRCGTPKNLKPQYRPKVRLPQPPELCNEPNKTLFTDGCEFAFRIQVSGHMKMRAFRPAAFERFEPFYDGCPIAKECVDLDCCTPDPLLYSSAPYHNSGSDGGYPLPIYPGYPAEYPTCDECNVVNPPPDTPGVIPPAPPTPVESPTVDFPGLPPVILLPEPDPEPWGNALVFHGSWDSPPPPSVFGNGFEIAYGTVPPEGLEDGVYDTWATQLWQQFSDYVIANGITVTEARAIIVNEGSGIGPGIARRWNANQVIKFDFWLPYFGMPFVIAIEYRTP